MKVKRIVITATVPDDTDVHDLATGLDGMLIEDDGGRMRDVTVWPWAEFWLDVREGVVEEEGCRS